MRIKSYNPKETRAFGAKLAKHVVEGAVYGLIGSLGSGKTEFVRGFVTELSSNIVVHSPSFSIVNTYRTDKLIIHHFDFFRLNSATELIEIGFDEYLDNESVCFIEWADSFPEVLPDNVKYIRFKEEKKNVRIITIDD